MLKKVFIAFAVSFYLNCDEITTETEKKKTNKY